MKILERNFLPKINKKNNVHASTIEKFNDKFIFSWFEGSREGAEDVFLNIYNLDKTSILFGDKDFLPRWNPILFNYKNTLFLFEKAGQFCDRWQTVIHDISNLKNDTTNKEIRSKQQILPCGLNGPVKTRPMEFNNIIYCGSSHETFVDWTSYIEEYKVEDNKFIYKNRSNPIYIKEKNLYKDRFSGATRLTLGIIQPCIWIENNLLHAVFRSSNGLNKIYYSFSEDGSVWKDPIETNLENPNSSIYILNIDGILYLVYNPSNSKRTPLIIEKFKQNNGKFEIYDKGSTLLINKEQKSDENVEFSYPYMIYDNGKIHLTYTFNRYQIEYCVIEI